MIPASYNAHFSIVDRYHKFGKCRTETKIFVNNSRDIESISRSDPTSKIGIADAAKHNLGPNKNKDNYFCDHLCH